MRGKSASQVKVPKFSPGLSECRFTTVIIQLRDHAGSLSLSASDTYSATILSSSRCGAQPAFYSMGSAGDSSEVKPMGREADNSPPSHPVRSASSEQHRDSFIAVIKNHD